MPARLEAHRIRRFVRAEHARSLAAAVYRVKTSESRGRVRIRLIAELMRAREHQRWGGVEATVS